MPHTHIRHRRARWGSALLLGALLTSLAWMWLLASRIPRRAATRPLSASISDSRIPSAGDRDADGVADTTEDDWLRRYAPRAWLHPLERYGPASVEWIRGRTGWHEDSAPRWGAFLHAATIDPAARRGCPDPRGWVVYGHAYPSSTGFTLQYWYYYPYNAAPWSLFDHDSDWEHVSVELDRSGVPQALVLARHDQNSPGVRFSWNSTARVDTHPLFRVARGTHAAYAVDEDVPFWEEVARCGGTSCAGRSWIPDDVVNLGEREYPRDDPSHARFVMRYAGAWGRTISLWSSGAPRGPPFQSGFDWDRVISAPPSQ